MGAAEGACYVGCCGEGELVLREGCAVGLLGFEGGWVILFAVEEGFAFLSLLGVVVAFGGELGVAEFGAGCGEGAGEAGEGVGVGVLVLGGMGSRLRRGGCDGGVNFEAEK